MKFDGENVLFIVTAIFLMISGLLSPIVTFVMGLVLTAVGITFAYKKSKRVNVK